MIYTDNIVVYNLYMILRNKKISYYTMYRQNFLKSFM